ncbi:MAG: hypothetical protein K2P94_03605 [Rhodospirillaceae bacterium]|nr:hypothetical protein [Rhodospirillaceae bacterium]
MSAGDVSQHLDQIVETAKNASVVVVKGSLQTDKMDEIPKVVLEWAEFIKALKDFPARALYLEGYVFSAENAVSDALDEALESEGQSSTTLSLRQYPTASALIRDWARYDGKTFGYAASFKHDGIFHFCGEATEWSEDFDEKLQELVAEILEDLPEVSDEGEGEREEVARMAKELVAHPKFSAPKATKAKRAALAQSLFQEIGDEIAYAVVEKAETLQWLKDE